MRSIVAGMAALYLLNAATATGQCVGTIANEYSGTSAVNVTWSTALSNYSTSISDAMDLWNASCDGMAEIYYPVFTTASGYPNIHIEFQSGHATTAECGTNNGNPVYCNAHYEPDNGRIVIFEEYGENGSSLFSSLSSAQIKALIAHELGHVLGVSEGTCGGIMDRPVSPTATPTGQECDVADLQNEVPQEPPTTKTAPPRECVDCYSPIIIDLDRNGYRLSGAESPVWFDMDGDGSLERLTWTNSADEAFLWIDRIPNGVVDDGRELFGNQVADNGFELLARYDQIGRGDVQYGGNGDGIVDAQDRIWQRLRLWIDGNHDGVSQPNELFTLAEKGVVAIDLNYRWSGRTDRAGNKYRYQSRAWIEAEAGKALPTRIYDVYFIEVSD